ncbi:MAG: glycosyltransferase family 4 protein, partial [Burkholderiales bacterium]
VKLLFADPGPVPGLAPSAIQVLQSVDGFARAGVEVTLMTPEPSRGIEPESVLGRPLARSVRLAYLPDLRKRWFFPASSSKPFYWMAARNARALAAAGDVEAVLVRNLKMAEVLLRAPGLPPVFFETHELFAQSFKDEFPERTTHQAKKLARLAEREGFVYRSAHGVATLTAALASDIRAEYRDVAPTVVVPDAVDLDLAAAAEGPRPANPRPVLLYLGSLHKWKGVEVAVAAMRELPGCELWIAGGSDARIHDMRRLSASLDLSERVQLLGRIEPRERFKLIAQADVCLLPLRPYSIGARYTSPLKLFEYMAMGKPVVASHLPSLAEVLVDRRNAMLVRPEDPRALANAVRSLIDDPALSRALGAEAKRLAYDRFGWVQRSSRLAEFIAEQLARPRT